MVFHNTCMQTARTSAEAGCVCGQPDLIGTGACESQHGYHHLDHSEGRRPHGWAALETMLLVASPVVPVAGCYCCFTEFMRPRLSPGQTYVPRRSKTFRRPRQRLYGGF